MLEIDGSIGEGGGQVLRTALALSAVLGKEVRIHNIRAGRSAPGLKPQHLAVCNALAKISGGEMKGAEIGSSEVVFKPGKAMGGEFEFDIGTAGACPLLLQAVLPVLLHAEGKSSVVMKGGTHVMAAPTFDYIANVFLPAIRLMGAGAKVEMRRAGFYPAGRGEMLLECSPSEISGAEFCRQGNAGVGYSIISSQLPSHVAKREEEVVLGAFPSAKGSAHDVPSACAGNAVTVWSGFFGASCLGKAGRKAEEVAAEACKTLAGEMRSPSSVDSRLADQLLLYAALARGKTSYSAPEFTQHLKTNALVVRAMTGRNIMLNPEGNLVCCGE